MHPLHTIWNVGELIVLTLLVAICICGIVMQRNITSMLKIVSFAEGDIYNEYSDLDWLDKSATSRGSIRASDLPINGSAVSMTSSNLAVADNDNNMRRLKQTLPQAQR